jgi:hypothetical protein
VEDLADRIALAVDNNRRPGRTPRRGHREQPVPPAATRRRLKTHAPGTGVRGHRDAGGPTQGLLTRRDAGTRRA